MAEKLKYVDLRVQLTRFQEVLRLTNDPVPDGVTSGSEPGRDAHSTSHRGASVRDTESVDGIDALPDQNARPGEYRDESARVGVQHEANDEHYRHKTSH